MLGVFWIVPIFDYILSGFKSFGYNFYDMLNAMIMVVWFSIFWYQFKRFNILKKLIALFLMVILQSSLPQKWDVNVSAGFVADMMILGLSMILTIVYHYKIIKGKIDADGRTISKEER
jgi:hypothetical protein